MVIAAKKGVKKRRRGLDLGLRTFRKKMEDHQLGRAQNKYKWCQGAAITQEGEE